MRKTLIFSLLFFLFLNILGCAALIIGGAAGALGAYAIGKDTIQGETDKPYDSLWSSAMAVARIRGVIKQENSLKGYIEMEASRSKVSIALIRLTQATTRLKIKARKYGFPNLQLAQDLYVRILEQAQESR